MQTFNELALWSLCVALPSRLARLPRKIGLGIIDAVERAIAKSAVGKIAKRLALLDSACYREGSRLSRDEAPIHDFVWINIQRSCKLDAGNASLLALLERAGRE